MVYKVAVVDDEAEIVEKLSLMLDRYSEKSRGGDSFVINCFNNGDEFLRSETNIYDIILLDINMPGTNGLKTAKLIRSENKTAVIIFCTHYAQYAVKGYEVNALGYLVKPIDENAFTRNIARAIDVLKSNQTRKLYIKTFHGMDVELISDIVYLEVQIHNLFYYALRGNELVTYKSRGTMHEMCRNLEEFNFARCSACYLINLNHVTSIRNGEVHLRGGKVLPISRKFLRSFTENFMRFLGKNGTVNV